MEGCAFSGKTHSMVGSASDAGIVQRSVDHLFDAIEESECRQFLIKVSYLEILRDLLEVSPAFPFL